jgi:AmmeMemoRadiSam system protein B
MFYPADAGALRAQIDECLAAATVVEPPPKALIAPHAGYVYSGPIAGSVYATLLPVRRTITRVVLLGPSHRVPFAGLAVTGADFFRTPLGSVPVDRAAVSAILELPQVETLELAHAQEHSLEVQVPFLQQVLEAFSLVPVVVGDATAEQVAAVLDRLWGGQETLIVISSDLSHYHDYSTAQRMDAATSHAIETLNGEALEFEDACGRIPVQGLLLAARRRGMHAKTLDLRNSGDTAGPKDRVVGYGSYAFH